INESYKINPHDEMSPIWRAVAKDEEQNLSPTLLFQQWLSSQGISLPNGWTASHWDVMFYDCQSAAFIGEAGDMVACSRLDNQVSCFAGVLALTDHVQRHPAGGHTLAMLACFDHEEVGSLSVTGAEGNLVESVISRIYTQPEDRWRALAQSWMLSVDNAHGCHPNYPGMQDDNHCPLINQGIVLKSNPNQRYATNAAAGGYFKGLCRQAGVAVQDFAVRSDMACGSTVGPPLSARLGIATADIGVPTWAMHSIREVAGVQDMGDLRRVLSLFYGPI
ncbi:MAG: M18 family aminopeptidase, partial [Magnetococcales bacterium]|nr:M18 family aminopeptidase [Magnetococcales bacterium]NGZ28973.1 M18 family aminopeptidase [Magnetococcales bacterium]